MCDAVRAESYKLDDVEVSNFLLPPYVTSSEEVGGRNDFLGRSHNAKTLGSFGVNPGGDIPVSLIRRPGTTRPSR